MSKTLTAGQTAEIAKPVTTPGYLVEIGFSTPFRASSRGDINWDGKVWITWGMEVQGLDTDAQRSQLNGSIVFQNTDNALGTLILLEGVADKPIKVWTFYGDTPGLFDPLPQVFGSCDEASVDPTLGRCTITVMQAGGVTLFCPRSFITRESGFNFLPPSGTIINWGGEQFRLERED